MLADKLSVLSGKKAVLVAVLALCLIVRLVVVANNYQEQPVSDAAMYVDIAENLVAGNGFALSSTGLPDGVARTTAGRDPLYPFVLAAFFLVFGKSLLAVYIGQAVLATITAFLLYKTAKLVTGSSVVAVVGMLFYSLNPVLAECTASALTETLATFLITIVIYTVLSLRNRPAIAYALPGLMLGLAILSRGYWLLFPLAAAVVFWRCRTQMTDWLKRAVIFTACAVVVVVPWTVRNYFALRGFIPVSSYGWQMMWGASGAADGFILPAVPWKVLRLSEPSEGPNVPKLTDKTYDYVQKMFKVRENFSEPESERIFRGEAIKQIRREPILYLRLAVVKVVRLWFNLGFYEKPSKASVLFAAGNLLLLVLAAIGGRFGNVSTLFKRTVIAAVLYVTIIPALTISSFRFTLPIMPAIIVLSSLGLCRLLNISDAPRLFEGDAK